LQSRVEKLLARAAGGIEPTTLNLSSQSGAYDHSATATPHGFLPTTDQAVCDAALNNLLQ